MFYLWNDSDKRVTKNSLHITVFDLLVIKYPTGTHCSDGCESKSKMSRNQQAVTDYSQLAKNIHDICGD